MKFSGRRGRFEKGSHVAKLGILPVVLIPVFVVIMVVSTIELLRPEMEQSEFEDLSAILYTTGDVDNASRIVYQQKLN